MLILSVEENKTVNIVVDADFDVNKGWMATNKNNAHVILDLNENKLEFVKGCFLVERGSTLTVKNGNMEQTADKTGLFLVEDGTLNLIASEFSEPDKVIENHCQTFLYITGHSTKGPRLNAVGQ